VRVQQVVPARFRLGLGPEHLKGELAYLCGQVLLVELLERASGHAADQDPWDQLGQRRRVTADRPGEDLNLAAAGGKPLGNLDNVDVQASGVASARLIER